MKLIDDFYSTLEELRHFGSVLALLGWDQQVYMPKGGAAARAEQIEYFSKRTHELATTPKFVDIVNQLNSRLLELSEPDQVNVRETHRSLQRKLKLPATFIAERAKVEALSFAAWEEARPKSDFASARPHLEKVIKLCREEAALVGFESNPYDALLDTYEPHLDYATIAPILLNLAAAISQMLPEIQQRTKTFLSVQGTFSVEQQHKLCEKLLSEIGFDLGDGRLDRSSHPFSTTIALHDHRVTTRFREKCFLEAVLTTLHEGGHALYEMGFPAKYLSMPLGSAASIGVHESQSRFWENILGRSKSYSIYLLELASKYFPAGDLTSQQIYQHMNRVVPSLIRVEADEVTYSLHVVIRMQLENDLINQRLSVAELPGAWNDLYKQYLGLQPSTDREGVLQDVHWYTGAIGYFPTYALGNIYCAQFLTRMRKDLGDLDSLVQNGRFSPILAWLRTNIHEQGMRYSAFNLIEKISAKPVSEQDFVEYLRTKYI